MSSFKLDMAGISKNLIEKEIKTKAVLGLYGDTVAKDMEGYSKENASWIDRSGSARQRLNGDSQSIDNKVRCSISHGVDYGVYLELCNEGEYSILEETIENVGPKAIKGLEKIFK